MKYEARIGEHTANIKVIGKTLHFAWAGVGKVTADFLVAELSPGSYSVLLGDRSFEVSLASNTEIIVNGKTFDVEIFDPREMRGRRGAGAGEGRQNIKAMMPGKVVRILVNAGDAVEAGQGVIVVEAMKMQNEMKSPKAGRVVEIKAKTDSNVAAGEVLMVIE